MTTSKPKYVPEIINSVVHNIPESLLRISMPVSSTSRVLNVPLTVTEIIFCEEFRCQDPRYELFWSLLLLSLH
jgi:hypothetical protein